MNVVGGQGGFGFARGAIAGVKFMFFAAYIATSSFQLGSLLLPSE